MWKSTFVVLVTFLAVVVYAQFPSVGGVYSQTSLSSGCQINSIPTTILVSQAGAALTIQGNNQAFSSGSINSNGVTNLTSQQYGNCNGQFTTFGGKDLVQLSLTCNDNGATCDVSYEGTLSGSGGSVPNPPPPPPPPTVVSASNTPFPGSAASASSTPFPGSVASASSTHFPGSGSFFSPSPFPFLGSFTPVYTQQPYYHNASDASSLAAGSFVLVAVLALVF